MAQTRWSDTDTGEHANVRTGKGGIALAGNLNFVLEAIIDKFTVRPEIFGERLGFSQSSHVMVYVNSAKKQRAVLKHVCGTLEFILESRGSARQLQSLLRGKNGSPRDLWFHPTWA